mmetsp:Transcript_59292/g.118982  ORF Transcript_59292/g.118982 Transcript_59292/m.118982 type:complete len:202 (-) Transcript_59292:256-861(-)
MALSDEEATQIISNLKNLGVNCLAIDFDRTLITSHTEGKFKGETSTLIESVRPVFTTLIPRAEAAGIHIIVVTFSPQVKLIREVLTAAIRTVAEIIVRGNDGTWQYSGQGSGEGKQAHISSAYEELSSRFGTSTTATADPTSDNPSPQVTSVTRASTLLIDDDVKNIRAALKHKTPAVLFNPFEHESEFVRSLLALGRAPL